MTDMTTGRPVKCRRRRPVEPREGEQGQDDDAGKDHDPDEFEAAGEVLE